MLNHNTNAAQKQNQVFASGGVAHISGVSRNSNGLGHAQATALSRGQYTLFQVGAQSIEV